MEEYQAQLAELTEGTEEYVAKQGEIEAHQAEIDSL